MYRGPIENKQAKLNRLRAQIVLLDEEERRIAANLRRIGVCITRPKKKARRGV